MTNVQDTWDESSEQEILVASASTGHKHPELTAHRECVPRLMRSPLLGSSYAEIGNV